MTIPIVKAQHLYKTFSSSDMMTHALLDINVEIHRGDYLSISGPSGCGKSTLLSLMGLLDFPTKGSLLFNGQDVTKLSLDQAARLRNDKVGIVFQQFNLIDDLSVFDNVALPLRYAETKVETQVIQKRVHQLLATVGLSNLGDHKPNQISGGQQQRVAIARALVTQPDILLVDEPTGNLDLKNSEEIMSLLGELNEMGTTVCLVTHEPRFANMAKRNLYLLDGQVLGQH